MNKRIDFYAHYHGRGHANRCRSIAKHLSAESKFLTSAPLDTAWEGLSQTRIIPIPLDPFPSDLDPTVRYSDLRCFHYAPVPCVAMAARAAAITGHFSVDPPVLLVVDVSVEVTLQARLCGIPTAVVRQHGTRDDSAHMLAYESAEFLIAPFPQLLEDDNTPKSVRDKTVYSSGFCRFSGQDSPPDVSSETSGTRIVITTGGGGEPLSRSTLQEISSAFAASEIHVIGRIDAGVEVADGNIHIHSWLDDPLPFMRSADLLICSAGHNAVMEAGWIERPFITVPEPRPFNEQDCKAHILANAGLAATVSGWDASAREWQDADEKARSLDMTLWKAIHSENGAETLARTIEKRLRTDR